MTQDTTSHAERAAKAAALAEDHAMATRGVSKRRLARQEARWANQSADNAKKAEEAGDHAAAARFADEAERAAQEAACWQRS